VGKIMRRKKRRIWEMDIEVLRHRKDGIIYGFNQFNSIDTMQITAENVLIP